MEICDGLPVRRQRGLSQLTKVDTHTHRDGSMAKQGCLSL